MLAAPNQIAHGKLAMMTEPQPPALEKPWTWTAPPCMASPHRAQRAAMP